VGAGLCAWSVAEASAAKTRAREKRSFISRRRLDSQTRFRRTLCKARAIASAPSKSHCAAMTCADPTRLPNEFHLPDRGTISSRFRDADLARCSKTGPRVGAGFWRERSAATTRLSWPRREPNQRSTFSRVAVRVPSFSKRKFPFTS